MTDEVVPVEPGSGVTAASPAAPVSDATPASSTAEAPGVEKTFFETVKAALDGSEETPASVDGGGKTPSEPTGIDGKDPDVPDEIKQLSDKAQDRFRDLVGQRKAVEAEREALRPKAEKFDSILTYLERHRIEPQEFDNALEITRMVKAGDYDKALEVLTPFYRELADRAGRILPAALQERVRLGYLTEDDAKALHASQTRAKNLETQTTEGQRRDQQERSNRDATQIVTATAQTADQWAKAKAGTDPDWNLKQDLVAEQVELDMTRRRDAGDREWFPKTAEEVVKRAEAALATVEQRFKKVAPKPVEKKVATGSPASPRSSSVPASYMDAVNKALGRTGS